MSNRDEFEEWISHGIDQGWISEVVCETHDGLPWTDEESLEWQDGSDFCVPAVRVYGLERVQ